eukprot:1725159-Alexandrium_andersonii.AAC.1
MFCLAEHAGELLTEHLVGHDGRAAFERLFGKPSRGDGYEFGKPSRSLNPRWGAGAWLGRRWGS